MKTEEKRNLLRQPDEIRLMTGSAQTEQETAPDAAAFRAGDVTVEFAEADGSLAVFVHRADSDAYGQDPLSHSFPEARSFRCMNRNGFGILRR